MQLEVAQKIVSSALRAARQHSYKPLAVVVLDARGALKAAAAEDGTSLRRAEIATAKAYGALAMGLGSRTLYTRSQKQPQFIAAATHAVGGLLVPVPGGVLIKDSSGTLIGAVGVSGDTSDNDEIAALAGIEAAGCTGDPGD
ncbi:MAG: heme-binding protein [Hyphomonadaceae bacterium]|nr:heme-binding protein [Hyphomonadaceae bacterium]